MALKDSVRPANKSAGGNGSAPFKYFGLAAKVIEVHEIDDDRVSLKVEALIDTDVVKKGEVVDVKFNDWKGKDIKCTESLKRSFGNTPDSIVMLENCRLDNGVVIANWMKAVAYSAVKNMTGDKRHKIRTLSEGYITQPVISFRNPDLREGEPPYINWPIMAEKASLLVEVKGRLGRREFDRAFAQEKLAIALGDGASGAPGVQIESSVYETHKAVAIASFSQLSEELIRILDQQNAAALIRTVDSDGEVFTRRVDVPYNRELGAKEKAVDVVSRLLERDIFGYYGRPEGGDRDTWMTVPNEAVATAMNNNEILVEIIPIRVVPYLGSNNQSSRMQLINSFINKAPQQMDDFSVPYGVGDVSLNRAVRMVTIEEPTKSSKGTFLVGTPMALSKDAFHFTKVPTANYTPEAQVANAPVQEETSGSQDDYIDGTDYELVSPSQAEAAGEPAVVAEVEAVADQEVARPAQQVRAARRF